MYMWCSGASSCAFTSIQIQSLNALSCYGFLSCTGSHILGVSTIYGGAAYSLYNATIDSNGVNTMKLYLRGYRSGMHARIICQPNDSCYIYCQHTGCNALHVNCTGNCIFQSVNQTNITLNTNTLFYYLKDIITHNDEECNNQTVSISFDGSNTPFSPQNINGIYNICCRSKYSCNGRNITHQTSSGRKLIASGAQSFEGSSLNVIDGLFCSGCFSCYDSVINTIRENIYCLGSKSCKHITIHQIIGNVTCFGSESCDSSTIYTSGYGNIHHMYLFGDYAARYATLYCRENDECKEVGYKETGQRLV
eukprot:927653_1